MPQEAFKNALKARAARVEQALEKASGAPEASGVPGGLLEAMRYSLLAGGKRLRPVLCLTTAGLFGLREEAVMPFAVGLECIHTYSLIHDDLPCMDDDDLRRGKPSCHKRFDECTAVLAGDSLLTDAFFFMSRCGLPGDGAGLDPARVLAAIAQVAKAAGSSGMAGGQFLDMAYTGGARAGVEELARMHALKTGVMLEAACVSGAILAGAPAEDVTRMAEYGKHIGAAFQIVDDILDATGNEEDLGKPVGGDSAKAKLTYPALLGLAESRRRAEEHIRKALAALGGYNGTEVEMLQGLARYVINRVS